MVLYYCEVGALSEVFERAKMQGSFPRRGLRPLILKRFRKTCL